MCYVAYTYRPMKKLLKHYLYCNMDCLKRYLKKGNTSFKYVLLYWTLSLFVIILKQTNAPERVVTLVLSNKNKLSPSEVKTVKFL